MNFVICCLISIHSQLFFCWDVLKSLLVGGLEHVLFFHILGISSSQLTFIFFRGIETTHQDFHGFSLTIMNHILTIIINHHFYYYHSIPPTSYVSFHHSIIIINYHSIIPYIPTNFEILYH